MDRCEEPKGLAENRENIYGLLARLYRAEVDQGLLDDLGRLSFPRPTAGRDVPQAWAEGLGLLAAWLEGRGPGAVKELAVDYARVFLGAGISDGRAAFPYESVYTSPERLIMQDARDQVAALYRERGLGVAEGSNEPEDHLAFELEFMAYLCRKGRLAVQEGREAEADALVAGQRAFIEAHLLNWIPAFCADVEQYAETDFYRAVAKMTAGFAELDARLLADLVAKGA